MVAGVEVEPFARACPTPTWQRLAHSSVTSLVDNQEVSGSIPLPPTDNLRRSAAYAADPR
jgi:hypothetical protein